MVVKGSNWPVASESSLNNLPLAEQQKERKHNKNLSVRGKCPNKTSHGQKLLKVNVH